MEPRELYKKSISHFLAPVRELLEDPDVSEIMINGGPVYYESNGQVKIATCRFDDEDALMAAAQNIAEFVNRPLDEDHHSLDARLPKPDSPEASAPRVHVIIPPASRQGIVITIRKFKEASFDLDTLVSYGSLTEEASEFLKLCVAMHKNIVISGGTGTGKTSLLNALSTAIPKGERVIVIEDTSELRLKQPHTLCLEAQPPRPDGCGQVSIRDLFVDALRMRPDRIIVGEVRRGEALDMIQSMVSGHAGSLATVHASSPRDAVSRLETLCLMSDVELPQHVARSQVASAIDVIVQISRFSDGSRKVNVISEIQGLTEANAYRVVDLYSLQRTTAEGGRISSGNLTPVGNQPTFVAEPYLTGLGEHVRLTEKLFSRDGNSDALQ